MADRYECDIDIRPLEKRIKDFTYAHGYDLTRVLDDLLDYIIAFFDIERKPIEGWRYSSEENKEFYAMMSDYFLILEKVIKKRPWYDAWGDLFMSIHPSGGGKGQFFTPDDICDLMAQITNRHDEPQATKATTFGKRVLVNDCSAGSSRNLLATHAVFVENKWRKPYLIAEDIDYTCCKMSAINMAVHGCFGEVVCHDTLTEPNEVRNGFVINEGLYPIPCYPTIRRVTDPRRFVTCGLWEQRKREKKEDVKATAEMKKNKQPQQLSIW